MDLSRGSIKPCFVRFLTPIPVYGGSIECAYPWEEEVEEIDPKIEKPSMVVKYPGRLLGIVAHRVGDSYMTFCIPDVQHSVAELETQEGATPLHRSPGVETELFVS